jgi:hypothetical protein
MTQDELISQLQTKAVRAAAIIGSDVVRELKIVVGKQAPLVPGASPPRAATRATPGAPPRKVTGRGQAGVVYKVEPPTTTGVTVKVGDNVHYMGTLEYRNHPWLFATVAGMMPRMVAKFNALMAKD